MTAVAPRLAAVHPAGRGGLSGRGSGGLLCASASDGASAADREGRRDANQASTRTTQLYDRRRDDVSLDEVERVAIYWNHPGACAVLRLGDRRQTARAFSSTIAWHL